MPEKSKNKKKAPKTPDELREKINEKKKVDTKEVIKQIATRDLLERDYKEDLLEIIFKSAPGISRKVVANRPTPEQWTEILKLSIEAAAYDNVALDKESNEKLKKIYERMSELAANLTVDKKLDKEFWFTKTSDYALGSFINSVIMTTQQGPLSESDLEKFR